MPVLAFRQDVLNPQDDSLALDYWEGIVRPNTATDTAIAFQEVTDVAGADILSVTITAPTGYLAADLPVLKLLSVLTGGIIVEIAELLSASSVPRTDGVTGGQVFTTEVNLADHNIATPALEYRLQAQYGGSQNSGRMGNVNIIFIGRSLGLGLGGAGSNSGQQLIYAENYGVAVIVYGHHAIGATVINVAASVADFAKILVGQHVVIGTESHIVMAKDSPAATSTHTLTLDTPLVKVVADSVSIRTSPMIGVDDTIVLPGGGIYEELTIWMNWGLWSPTRTAIGGDGNTHSSFFTHADGRHGTFQRSIIPNGNYSFGNLSDSPTATFSLGAIYSSNNHLWFLEYDPRTGTLFFLKYNAYASVFYPAISFLMIAGR